MVERSSRRHAHDCSVCLLLFGDNQENLIKVDLSDIADYPVSRFFDSEVREAVGFQREEHFHVCGEGAFVTD